MEMLGIITLRGEFVKSYGGVVPQQDNITSIFVLLRTSNDDLRFGGFNGGCVERSMN